MPVDTKFVEEVVEAHNKYRSIHQVSPIKHAKDLSEYAQKWADHLVATDSFQHSSCNHKGDRLGENIAMKQSSSPTEYTGQDATDQWYSEIKDHTFGTDSGSPKSGHFTQVVWKGSAEMGVGKAASKDGKTTIVVASYRPAGNMMGDYAKNVLPTKDGKYSLPVKKDEGGSDGPTGATKGRSIQTTTRTVTEGHGANKITKTIVEETITEPDGSTHTTTTETVTSG